MLNTCWFCSFTWHCRPHSRKFWGSTSFHLSEHIFVARTLGYLYHWQRIRHKDMGHQHDNDNTQFTNRWSSSGIRNQRVFTLVLPGLNGFTYSLMLLTGLQNLASSFSFDFFRVLRLFNEEAESHRRYERLVTHSHQLLPYQIEKPHWNHLFVVTLSNSALWRHLLGNQWHKTLVSSEAILSKAPTTVLYSEDPTQNPYCIFHRKSN